jgi:hypothetical protein
MAFLRTAERQLVVDRHQGRPLDLSSRRRGTPTIGNPSGILANFSWPHEDEQGSCVK